MKKMYIGIYAVIALLIILGTFSWFVFGIIKDSDAGAEEARSIFAYFAKQIIVSAEKENFADKAYNQNLYSIAEELELKAFIISKDSKNVVVSWPKNSELISYDEQGNFIIRPDSLFVKNFSGNISVKAIKDYNTDLILTASIPTLKSGIIYIRLRSAFFIMLTIVLLTAIVILITNLSNTSERVYADIPEVNKKTYGDQTSFFIKNETIDEASPKDEVYPDIKEDVYSNIENTYNENNRDFDSSGDSEALKADKPAEPDYTDDDVYSLEDLDNLSITKHFPYESGVEPIPDDKKNITYISSDSDEYTELKNTKKNSVPNTGNTDIDKVRGLYSPITGISWQEYLPEYLESELRRAASSEQDIALVIMKLKDFTLESLIGKKIAALLIDFIKFRDMIFEFDENGFAAILQDTNLDEAMKKAEEIYKGTKSILNEYDISEPISIGITTRTSRLISSGRMIEEAQAAVNRAANNNEDPIVAFRVNPEKYREFISDN